MGRSESKKVVNQGTEQSAEDQKNAQSSLAATNKAVTDYQGALSNFMRFGRKVYGQGGEFAQDQNAIATTTAKAGSDRIAGDLALNASRTGENSAGYAGTLAESQRQGERDMTSQLASADASRLDKLTGVEQYGVEASKFPAGVEEALYGHSLSGASGELSAASGAARTPGFWDEFLPALAGAAGQVGKGFTPHG